MTGHRPLSSRPRRQPHPQLLPPVEISIPDSSTAATSEPPLLLTIRPDLDIPEIHLDVAIPSHTPIAGLKQQVRQRLGPGYARRKIRLIHQGRILRDDWVLGEVVRPAVTPTATPPPLQPLQPPPRARGKRDDDDYDSSRGRVGVGDSSNSEGRRPSAKAAGKRPQPQPSRVFINASIGDNLPAALLEEERSVAIAVVRAVTDRTRQLRTPNPVTTTSATATTASASGSGVNGAEASTSGTRTHTVVPGPRGFDRLLSAGFTRHEVRELRLQFRSLQASMHTADTMPSQDRLRDLEDAWIDTNAFNQAHPADASNPQEQQQQQQQNGGNSNGETGGGTRILTDDPSRHLLDSFVPALAVGFFMPLATVAWLARQEGVASLQFRLLVLAGFAASLVLGCVKGIAGDT